MKKINHKARFSPLFFLIGKLYDLQNYLHITQQRDE